MKNVRWHALSRLFQICFIIMGLISINIEGIPKVYILQHPTNQSSINQYPIRLVLRTAKIRWRYGDQNEVTAYLENLSDKPYYIGNEFFGFGIISSFHFIELKITDERSSEINGSRMSITQLWKAGTTVTEKIEQEYIKLGRGMIHGLSVRGNWELPPGQYRLTAIYHEVEAVNWTEQEKSALPFPVWTQPLTSNTVFIIVLPQTSYKSNRKRSLKER